MYVQRNIEASSCNHCCCGKTSITYSECVFLALVVQYAVRMRHIVMGGLCNMFPHYLINGTILKKKYLLSINCVF
jgi:hypothetical protein